MQRSKPMLMIVIINSFSNINNMYTCAAQYTVEKRVIETYVSKEFERDIDQLICALIQYDIV